MKGIQEAVHCEVQFLTKFCSIVCGRIKVNDSATNSTNSTTLPAVQNMENIAPCFSIENQWKRQKQCYMEFIALSVVTLKWKPPFPV